jgi:hypothetical protein
VPGGEMKDAGVKELVGNSHESRRVEETCEGGRTRLFTTCSAADDDDAYIYEYIYCPETREKTELTALSFMRNSVRYWKAGKPGMSFCTVNV